jgi:hypothetical protein
MDAAQLRLKMPDIPPLDPGCLGNRDTQKPSSVAAWNLEHMDCLGRLKSVSKAKAVAGRVIKELQEKRRKAQARQKEAEAKAAGRPPLPRGCRPAGHPALAARALPAAAERGADRQWSDQLTMRFRIVALCSGARVDYAFPHSGGPPMSDLARLAEGLLRAVLIDASPGPGLSAGVLGLLDAACRVAPRGPATYRRRARPAGASRPLAGLEVLAFRPRRGHEAAQVRLLENARPAGLEVLTVPAGWVDESPRAARPARPREGDFVASLRYARAGEGQAAGERRGLPPPSSSANPSPADVSAAKLEAVVRLLLGAESDWELLWARQHAQAVAEMSDAQVLALARGEVKKTAAGGPLRHARRGDFLDMLRS